jgi:hypothetical protein
LWGGEQLKERETEKLSYTLQWKRNSTFRQKNEDRSGRKSSEIHTMKSWRHSKKIEVLNNYKCR